MSQQNLETVRSLYAAIAKGEVPTVLGLLAPHVEWREADNFIYADGNPYVGPSAVLQGVFLRLATEWDGFAAAPQQFHDAGDTVIVTGRYTAAYKATGKKIDAPLRGTAHTFATGSGQRHLQTRLSWPSERQMAHRSVTKATGRKSADGESRARFPLLDEINALNDISKGGPLRLWQGVRADSLIFFCRAVAPTQGF